MRLTYWERFVLEAVELVHLVAHWDEGDKVVGGIVVGSLFLTPFRRGPPRPLLLLRFFDRVL